jgi:multidrug efflux pump subunit AcrB
LDSIVQEREKIPDPKEAAIIGASKIAAAQFFSMLTNVTVFFPLLFARGVAQQIFGDLFFAAVISNIAALVIALTLLPRISAYPMERLKKTPRGPQKIPANRLEKIWATFRSGLKKEQVQNLIQRYRVYLELVLTRRRVVMGWSLAALALALLIFMMKEIGIFMNVHWNYTKIECQLMF